MKDTELPVVKNIESKFSDRVVSLVGYGSYFFDRAHNGSDIDLCLLLNTRDQNDLTILHDIITDSKNSHVDITVHYLDEIEQWGWENFHHGTHGIFFLHHLANATVLMGGDIFARKSAQVPIQKYRESLISQIFQYVDRIQVRVIHDSSVPIDYFRKYLTRTMVDMLLLESEISYREVNTNSAIDVMENFIGVSKVFSGKSKELHKKVMTQDANRKDISDALQYVVYDFQKQLNRVYGNAAQ